MKFVVNALNIGIHGRHTNSQSIGDFLIIVALSEKFQDLTFATAETGEFIVFRRLTLEGLNYFAGNVAAHGRSTFVDFLQGGNQDCSRPVSFRR